tara:strand:- start:4022 stop:4741 length:720 start_codon:yes stop_codon:yes gene_type:complete
MSKKLSAIRGLVFAKLNLSYILIVFLSCLNIIGQEKLNNSGSTSYRKDQIYFGASFMLLNSDQEKFKRQGISKQFQLGFVRDIPLISSRKLAIGLGLGYSFQDYNSNLVRFNINNGNSIFIINYTLNQKSKLSFNFIEFPISLRWRNISFNNKFERVYAGFKFQRNFLSKLKYRNGDIKNISDEVNNWNKELYLSFGYNTWNVYLSYDLNQIMKNFYNQYSGKSFNVKSIKIGLIFYML